MEPGSDHGSHRLNGGFYRSEASFATTNNNLLHKSEYGNI